MWLMFVYFFVFIPVFWGTGTGAVLDLFGLIAFCPATGGRHPWTCPALRSASPFCLKWADENSECMAASCEH